MLIEADPPVDGFVLFEFGYEDTLYPSFSLSIETESRGFAGANERVWFGRKAFNEFLNQLNALERKRQGEAFLRSMSYPSEYDSFHFKIYSIDKLGHIALSTEIMQLEYIGGTPILVTNKVSITFQIDPTSLRSILADFRKLRAQHNVGSSAS